MATAAAALTDHLRDQAIALPRKDRADLAYTLMRVLDGKPVPSDSAAGTRTLCDRAIRLPADEQNALVRDLTASLDGPPQDPDEVAAAWGKEIRRRIAEIDSGEAELLTWEECERRAQAAIAAVKPCRK